MRRPRLLSIGGFTIAALVVTSCGAQTDLVTTPPIAPPDDAAQTRLTVTVRQSPEQQPQTWVLTCDPAGGDHPRAEAACRALATARRPFAPVRADITCTQQYGGPQTASISGLWRGERVIASYQRTDGCEIARWDALSAVLGPGGV